MPENRPSAVYRVAFWLIDRLRSIVLLAALDLVERWRQRTE
jgi:hypothetical protein